MTVLATLIIESSAGDYLYDSIDDIPYNRAGLLLGTTPYRAGGGRNPYFYERIDAAARLYRAGKISMIIVSGDNATRKYNEPRAMRRALIRAGVPGKAIVFDFAGFRTLDSIVRASLVFGQSSCHDHLPEVPEPPCRLHRKGKRHARHRLQRKRLRKP